MKFFLHSDGATSVFPDDFTEQPVIDVDRGADRDTRPPSPCCARIRSASGASSWCHLPEKHVGDHHGISAAESPLAPNEYGPKRAQQGAKR